MSPRAKPTPWLDFSLIDRFPLVRQSEAAECGLACLAMVANHHGDQVSLQALRQTFDVSLKGCTARDLVRMAKSLGFSTRAVRCELADLPKLRLPAILHWNLGHFVVLYKANGKTLSIADPSTGSMTYTLDAASPHFTGVAIELAPASNFQTRPRGAGLKLSGLVRFAPGVLLSFGQAAVLSLLLQLTLLAPPLYMQMVIDQAIQKGDADLLTLLFVAAITVTLFGGVAGAMRGLVSQYLSNVMSYDMNSSLFHHLVRLPLAYFQKRHAGDLQQRFRATAPIQQAIGPGAVQALIDGALSLVALGIMIFYALPLTLVVLLAVALSIGIKLSTIGLVRRASANAIVAEAREQTRFLETLRAIATIKVNAAEPGREDLWRNLAADTINAQIKRGNITILSGGVSQSVGLLSDALIIYLGASAVLDGKLTIGVLTAFLAYKGQFAGRVMAFVDQMVTFSLLDVQLDRIADIALATPEPPPAPDNDDNELRGEFEIKNLAFRYAPMEPEVLRAVDLHVRAGEFVAITGRSGGGKSTLMRLLLGLMTPTRGEILIDGRPIHQWPPSVLRRQISLVMQDDQLLGGTLADNIAMFEDMPDLERIRWAAKLAGIDQEISAFPMGYHSLVGDMGSSLSGGQKQRIMIARALYRGPKVLLLDEGTSHLDLARERTINEALQSLSITRIIVAHRPETIAAADRVYTLAEGRLHG